MAHLLGGAMNGSSPRVVGVEDVAAERKSNDKWDCGTGKQRQLTPRPR
jgi:hypothetical protein